MCGLCILISFICFSSSFFFEPSWSGQLVARSSTFCSTRGQQRPTSGLEPLGSSMDVLPGWQVVSFIASHQGHPRSAWLQAGNSRDSCNKEPRKGSPVSTAVESPIIPANSGQENGHLMGTVT